MTDKMNLLEFVRSVSALDKDESIFRVFDQQDPVEDPNAQLLARAAWLAGYRTALLDVTKMGLRAEGLIP